MPRKILRDDQYARIEEMLPGKVTDVGREPTSMLPVLPKKRRSSDRGAD